jgi:penicillin-binding protein 1B
MKNKTGHRRKKSILSRVVPWVPPALLFALSVLAVYSHRLSEDIDRRFSGRRWRVPSVVYSDTTLLYPGQQVNPSFLLEKLERLGYRGVSHRPGQKGEMYVQPGSIELFLNDLDLPFLEREGFPVHIAIHERTITTISHAEHREALSYLELAPEELMRFYGPEREQRRLISIAQVPPHVRQAFLAAEDVRFYDHHGIDPWGILRAAYINLRHKEVRQGGSTITQQLAKNYFLTPERTFSRKAKEMLMAVIMELMFEKDEILEIYLNEIYFGQKGTVGVNGLGEASYFYFGKPVEDLRPDEAALIAGIVRAPALYSPHLDRRRCEDRRDHILQVMADQGWISTDAFQKAVNRPVEPVGFRAYGRKAPYFVDYLSHQIEALYSKEDLSKLGLSVFTTLDTQIQEAAEKALSRGLKRLERSHPALRRNEPERRLQGAVLVVHPKTGYILAMVGGRNYSMSQFNRVTQARRQPGSAFKPFVFLAALDRGYTPTSRLSNAPRTYTTDGVSWEPTNFAPVNDTRVSLRTALAKSINLATVDLAMQVGVDTIVRKASGFEFSTPMRPLPAIALGAMEVVPLELARAYCAFAADGMLPRFLSVKDVADEKGAILEQRYMTAKQVISPAKAFMMSSLLRSVVTEGTARGVKKWGLSHPMAGKTGTTDNYRDAWFIGYTPDLLALVWIGFDDGASVLNTGASAALPIWADLMKQIPQHLSGAWFPMPPGVLKEEVCAHSGRLAVPGCCPATYEEYFLVDHLPTESCRQHNGIPFLTSVARYVEELFSLD